MQSGHRPYASRRGRDLALLRPPLTRPFSQATRRGGDPARRSSAACPWMTWRRCRGRPRSPELPVWPVPVPRRRCRAAPPPRRPAPAPGLQVEAAGAAGRLCCRTRGRGAGHPGAAAPAAGASDALSCRHQVHQGICMSEPPADCGPGPRPRRPGQETTPSSCGSSSRAAGSPESWGRAGMSAHFLGVDKVITSRRNRHGRPLFPVRPRHLEAAAEFLSTLTPWVVPQPGLPDAEFLP